MQLQKPPLFTDTKSLIWVLLVVSFVIILRLALSYQEYRSFIAKPFYYTYAEVMSEKVKTSRGKSYKILKLREENGLHFITASYLQNSYRNKRLRLQIFPDEKITFRGYMSSFFVKSRIKEVHPVQNTYKDSLLKKVAQQHQSQMLASFYNAIFLQRPYMIILETR